MLRQRRFPKKTFPANFAPKRFILSVNFDMAFQVLFRQKLLPASLAFFGRFRVRFTLVSFEQGGGLELLLAAAARVQDALLVHLHVLSQVPHVVELLPAQMAFVNGRFGVQALHVARQTGLSGEGLGALFTVERLDVGCEVLLQVSLQDKPLLTHQADVVLLARVVEQVLLEVALQEELFAAFLQKEYWEDLK